jgi:serine/threonine protein kinase/Tol biopolymer transport system component
MSLSPGTRLGSYEIVAPIGVGGMGEVYRAKDCRLGRSVALKALPEELFEDEERRQRFEREARLLATLNHPGIAAIYSFEEIPGTSPSSSRHVLSMEMVEGEDLAEKLLSGPLALEESLSLARQIAEALEVAHEKGIVHRDLKPANVKVTEEGKVKLLDFGLAKAIEGERNPSKGGSDGGMTRSPTLTARATAAGVILGTAAYMSPEQARGKAVDKRTDVWAFGCVLFEMLTGKRAFEGETVSDTIAAVLTREPDWSAFRAPVSSKVKELLRRCLQRDVKQRLRDIGDARIALDEELAATASLSSAGGATAPGSARLPSEKTQAAPSSTVGRSAPAFRERGSRKSFHLSWAIAAAFAAAAGVSTVLALRARSHEPRVFRATINPPPGTVFLVDTTQPGPPVLSPDGRTLAFTARGADGSIRLYVRSLDSMQARALSGTEGAQYPFWSPDSRFVAFFAQQKLKKIEASGGPPAVLCVTSDFPKGGAWSPKGVIVFAPGPTGGLSIVSEGGGEPKLLTKLDMKRGDNSHRNPSFLPDGRRFLFVARLNSAPTEGHQILVGSIDGGEPRPVVRSPAAAEYASGYLLYLRDRVLVAQRFDLDRLELTGEVRPLAENVTMLSGAAKALLSVSEAGVLVVGSGSVQYPGARLEWVDRAGKKLGELGDRALWDLAVISPDGKSVAGEAIDENVGTSDIWILDVGRGLRSRFTFDPGNDNVPCWSPDGRWLVYVGDRGSEHGLYRKPVTGSGDEELLFASKEIVLPTDVSPDGRTLAFKQLGETGYRIWMLPLTGERKPRLFLNTVFGDTDAVFSPDGHWVAYTSSETGQSQVYVTPFPDGGRKWQVSAKGDLVHPRWRQGGRELIFQDLRTNKLFAVTVTIAGGTPEFGPSEELFSATPPYAGLGARFDPSADGKKFLIVRPEETRESGSLTLIVNWTAELKGK